MLPIKDVFQVMKRNLSQAAFDESYSKSVVTLAEGYRMDELSKIFEVCEVLKRNIDYQLVDFEVQMF